MKTAICYYSTHHGNTLQVARAMTQGYDVDFFDLSTQREAALADYDLVGFASGIYGFAFHPSVVAFARKYLPQGKAVFFVYTYGIAKGTGAKEITKVSREKSARILGNLAAGATIPLAPSSSWAAAARADPPRRISTGRGTFSKILLINFEPGEKDDRTNQDTWRTGA